MFTYIDNKCKIDKDEKNIVKLIIAARIFPIAFWWNCRYGAGTAL